MQRRHWSNLTLLDGFLGGGSVSLFGKAQGLSVVSCDVAERAIVVGQALIENTRVRLTKEDVLRVAAPNDSPPGRIEQNYVPGAFSRAQARLLDRCLAVAEETRETAKAALFRLLAIRVALLAHPLSQVREGTMQRVVCGDFESVTESCLPQYVAGLRLTRIDQLWDLAQQINGGVFQGEARVIKASIIDALPNIQADVFYADPPYPGTSSYEREYKVIDEFLEGAARPVSPFSAKDGAGLLDVVFERAVHIPIWILSLGNAVVGVEELEAKMAALGRETRAVSVAYAHKPSVASEGSRRENRELVVVGWDESSELIKEYGRCEEDV